MELLETITENGVEYVLRKEGETTYYYPTMENQKDARIFKSVHFDEKRNATYTSYWNPEGYRHRIDGPAIIHPNGQEEFFIHGEKIEAKDTEEFFRLLKLQAFK